MLTPKMNRPGRFVVLIAIISLVFASSSLDKSMQVAPSSVATSLATSVYMGVPTGRGIQQNESLDRQERDQKFLLAHKDSSGQVRPDLWKKGMEKATQMKITAGIPRASAGNQLDSGLTGVQWTSIGPAPLRVDSAHGVMGAGPDSGEVVDIAIDPRGSTDQVIYIASNDGGIWKSTDGGTSWKAKSDYMPSSSMGAVALDPNNPSVVYAGTGNPFDGAGRYCCFGSFSLKGIGIYKSIDGGETWTVLNPFNFSNPNGIFTGNSINRIVFPSPATTPNTLLVATGQGLYRSVDGGASFGSNSPLFNNGNPILGAGALVSDLKVDTATPSTVYAAVNGQGIFQSTDGGVTFPTNLFNNTGAPPAGYQFVSFAQSTQPDNQTIYASVQANAGGFLNVFKSTDRGATWSTPFGGPTPGCQCGYDQTIGVDPKDPGRVYLGFVNMFRSTDGGSNFGTVGDNDIHDDHHAVIFSPSTHTGGSPAPTRMYVGTDGGISTTSDGGNSWADINEGIGTNLLGTIDIGRGSTANRGYTYGSSQDTGVEQRQPGYPGTDWHLNTGGDGNIVVVDPANAMHAYSAYNAQLVGTNDGGGSWSILSATGLPHSGCCGLVGNLGLDPNNGATVYAMNASQLFQSTDSGSNFTLMKTFPSGPTLCCTGIFALATVKIDSNTLWVGLADGTIWVTANALSGASSTWTQHVVTGAPRQSGITMPVNGLAIDPTNTAQVAVVYGGFTNLNAALRTRHVFRTTDNGTNWSDISGTDGGDPTLNLPDLPVSSVVIDAGVSPHAIIVASDAGVFRSANNGATWKIFGVGLPVTLASMLQIDPTANPPLLRVGTYGRSVFELTSASGPLLAVNANLAFGIVPVGGNASRIVQLFNVGSSDLHINSFDRVAGSPDFQVISGPPTPTTIPPGAELDYTVRFAPSSGGNKTATFQVNSDDPFQPAFQLQASGTGGVPTIVLSGDLNFGTVAKGTVASRNLIVNNTGYAPLVVSNMFFDGSSDPEFSVLGPATPQTIQPGSSLTFVIRFSPPANSVGGARSGTLRINSNDPTNPSVTVPASGIVGIPITRISTGALSFGSIAVDDRTIPNTSDQTLHITNQASCAGCDLTITSLPISGPNAADYTLVSPPSLPLVVGAGNSIDLTIRFNPSNSGLRSATLTVNSNDPGTPSVAVSLSGVGLKPGIMTSDDMLIFPPTVYDSVCGINCGKTINEGIINSGPVELILDVLSFSGSSAFSGPGPTSPLTRVQPGPGQAFQEPVTFHPVGAAARKLSGNLHIQDNLGGVVPVVQGDVALCGESVGRGIRVLVYDPLGNIVTSVDRLKLQSNGLTHPVNIQERNLPLTTIDPPVSCQRIRYHYENQNLEAASKAGQRGSYYILTIDVGHRHSTLSFTLEVNEFKTIVATVQ